MVDSLAQIILAARNGDGSPWQQMLVFVVLAVFWAVGGILKARAAKSERQKEQQQPPKRPPRPQPRPLQPRPVAAAQSLTSEYDAKTRQGTAAATFMPPEFKIPEPVLSKPLGLPKKLRKPVSRVIAKPSLELDSPRMLRKAILHYEILGKPLAMRDPQGSAF